MDGVVNLISLKIQSVKIDDKENLFVVDTDNYRIQKWAKGASEGITVAGGNDFGNELNQLDRPIDINIDDSGNLYILEMNSYRAKMGSKFKRRNHCSRW